TSSGAVTEYPGAKATAIAPGADHNMWFVGRADTVVGRITPDGVVAAFPLPPVIAVTPPTAAMIAGPDRRLWIALGDAADPVATDGTVTQSSLGPPTGAYFDGAIAAGPDGTIWVARGTLIQRVRTNGTVAGRITLPASVTAMVSGPVRRVWLTMRNA